MGWCTAVSYTHLDVYKRQAEEKAKEQTDTIKIKAYPFNEDGDIVARVELSLIHISKFKGKFSVTKELITNLATGSEMKYNTSNAKTKDGKQTGCPVSYTHLDVYKRQGMYILNGTGWMIEVDKEKITKEFFLCESFRCRCTLYPCNNVSILIEWICFDFDCICLLVCLLLRC